MSDFDVNQGTDNPGRISASITSVISLLRGSALLVSPRPGSLLRILCLVAFDTQYTLRTQRRLSYQKLKTIAALLDLGACVNTYFDDKDFSRREYRATRELLKEAGVGRLVDDYLGRLRVLEAGRPLPGGDPRRYQQTRFYREAIVRLSLGLITSYSFDAGTMDEGLGVFRGHADFDIIFRIVMQCQIIDDAIDHEKDDSAGLPSFLTATGSRAEAMGLARQASASYRDIRGLSPSRSAFPFVVALFAVSASTRWALMYSRWRLF